MGEGEGRREGEGRERERGRERGKERGEGEGEGEGEGKEEGERGRVVEICSVLTGVDFTLQCYRTGSTVCSMCTTHSPQPCATHHSMCYTHNSIHTHTAVQRQNIGTHVYTYVGLS